MEQFDLYNLLLCYKYFSAKTIQITNLTITIIGCFIIKYGLRIIPFFIEDDIYEFFFFINIPYFFLIIFFNIIFFIFRYLRLMNDELNLWGFGLAIIEIYISIFGIITNFIDDFLIFYNISLYQKKSQKNSKKYPLLTNDQLVGTKIILPLIVFLWINILYLSITDCILINFKINGSYHTYQMALKQENLIFEENMKKNFKPKKNKNKKKKKEKKKDKEKEENKTEHIEVKNDINNNETNISMNKQEKNINESNVYLNNEDENNNNIINNNLNNNENKKEERENYNVKLNNNDTKKKEQDKNKNNIKESSLGFVENEGALKDNLKKNEEEK